MKNLVVLGSTGSVGTQTLSVIEHLGSVFQLVGLSSYGSDEALLTQQIAFWKPRMVALENQALLIKLSKQFPETEFVFGEEGLIALASLDCVDLVLVAIAGMSALSPCLSAIRSGKTIALASKEILASAGEFIMREVKQRGVNLIPVDSEHSGVFQCLEGRNIQDVARIILTASGGPLFNMSLEDLKSVAFDKVINHPNWNMGPKITVDSSTLVNKGLELIEAFWLFGVDDTLLDTVIHPQSIIHALVEFKDGSILAQMSEPSMTYPIQYALTWPFRGERMRPPFDFTKDRNLSFYPSDDMRFPALPLAKEVLKLKKSYACCYNAANDVLVKRFLNREISWFDISAKLCDIVEAHKPRDIVSVEDALDLDHSVRQEAFVQ